MPRRVLAWSLVLSLTACTSPVTGSTETETETGTEASSGTTTSASGTSSGTGGTTTPTTGEATTTTSSSSSSSTTGGEDGNPLVSDRFLNIAHRGGRVERPEATLPAFENALAVGADILEFDLHASADGMLMVMHDDTVDRTTDGTGAIADLTFAELRMLDAGYRFTTDDGQTFPYRGMGIVIPTLEEVLSGFPAAYCVIEIKQDDPPIVDAVVAALADHDALERVVLAAFDDETMQAIRAAAPEVLTSMSGAELILFNASIGDPEYVPPAMFVQPPWDLATEPFINHAHRHGLKVHPWTVNNTGTMADLIALGVDGIMTDDPALLASVAP